MKIEESIRLIRLFDLYGCLLSKKQADIFSMYIESDITPSEIAVQKNITRQAVQDNIKKCEAKLTEFENKLHMLELTDKYNELLKSR